jgi:transaldolase
LILAASKKPEYAKLMDVAIEYGKSHAKDIDEQVDATLDRLLVEFGKEILKIVPGKVSTEVDARFSFDKQGSIDKALHIIEVRIIPNPASLSNLTIPAIPIYRHTKRAYSHQDCLDMGRYPSRQSPPKGPWH